MTDEAVARCGGIIEDMGHTERGTNVLAWSCPRGRPPRCWQYARSVYGAASVPRSDAGKQAFRRASKQQRAAALERRPVPAPQADGA